MIIFPAVAYSQSTATVTNNVNVTTDSSGGGSSTHTSITTSDGDKTTHVESNEPGEVHVETKNGQTTVQTSPGMKVDVKSDSDTKIEDNLSSSSSADSEVHINTNHSSQSAHPSKPVPIAGIKSEFLVPLKSFWNRFLRFLHF